MPSSISSPGTNRATHPPFHLCPQCVPAGCVLAIGGLDRAVLKSATLASSPATRPLAPMVFQVGPCTHAHTLLGNLLFSGLLDGLIVRVPSHTII